MATAEIRSIEITASGGNVPVNRSYVYDDNRDSVTIDGITTNPTRGQASLMNESI